MLISPVDLYRDHIKTHAKRLGAHELISTSYRSTLPVQLRIKSHLPPSTVTYSIEDTTVTFKLDEPWKVDRFSNRHNEWPVIEDIVNSLQPDDVFWDIGAYLGWQTCFACSVIENGSVVSVEGHPETAQKLRIVLDDTESDAILVEYVLGDKNKEVKFTKDSVTNANIVEKDNDGIYTSMRTGDSMIKEMGLPKPTVLKIDVEGSELEVINGLTETIQESCRLIYCELHPNSLAKQDKSEEIVINQLTRIGFEPTVIYQKGNQPIIRASINEAP